MASGCPLITGGDPAVNAVTNVQSTVMGFAGQAFNVAVQQIAALNQFRIDPYIFSINFEVDGEVVSYHRPDGVDDPDIEYDPHVVFPTRPNIQWPSAVTPDSPPTFDEPAPILNIPTAPSLLLPPDIDAPNLVDPEIPTAPTIALPAVPTLRNITLPTEPTINIPTFNGIVPVNDIVVPDFDFDFTPAEYVSELLDRTRTRILEMQEGGTGLPAAIEQALFARAVNREDANDLKAITEAEEQVSSRGFTEPNGILERRMAEIRTTNRMARAGFVRDNLIQVRNIEIENMRFSVQQGIALEQVIEALFLKQQELLLDSLKFRAELEERVLQARIAIVNLDAAIYQATAVVFRDLIQAELAKLEIYRTQLEGRRLIGTLNQQDIDLYLAKLKGVEEIISLFHAQIDAANAITQNNNARVQAYVGMQQGRSETIRGLGLAFDGYKTAVEAEGLKEGIYETSTRAFGSRIQAYQTQQGVKLDAGRFRIDIGKAQLEQWSRESENVVEQLRAEALTVTTKLEVFKGLLARMQTYADIEKAASDANGRQLELALRKAEAEVQAQLKSVDLTIDQNEKIKSIILEAMRTAATAGAQLAGSSLAALNASASIGHTTSQSSGCSTSFSGSLDPGDT